MMRSDHVPDSVIAHLDRAIAQVMATTEDPVQRVIAFVRIFEEGADERMAAQSGCLYISVLTERQLAVTGTWPQINNAILAWRAGLSRLITDALATRRPPSPIDADALADHVFVTFEGAFILSRSLNDPQHMRAQLTVHRHLLEALFAEFLG